MVRILFITYNLKRLSVAYRVFFCIKCFIFYLKEEKREVPSLMRKCLAVDAYLTNVVVNWAEQSSYLRQLKIYHKVLWVRVITYLFLLLSK